jgi:uncharacterized protein (TIGR00255 family)
MIRSMTGFGSATVEFASKKITIEIRSVNSKFLDLNLRLPSAYKEKEMMLRAELSRLLERGKAEVNFNVESTDVRRTGINRPLAKAYYEEFSSLSKELNLGTTDFLRIILTMPDVMNAESGELNPEEWTAVETGFRKAVENFNSFRKQEGLTLENDMSDRIAAIVIGITELEKHEQPRIDSIRKRLQGTMDEFIQFANIDRNRFEQELIFYIEKLDISEEKVRLRNHCEYFMETIKSDPSAGKKMNFISQEIGREINTIGAKANDANMQRIVVNMKDELEKIKEQSLNIL